MSDRPNFITRGMQLALRRVPRKMKSIPGEEEVSVFDSEEFAYLVNLNIGGQDFWVTFDTGSSDLWVVSSGCANPDCQGVLAYSPSASPTLHSSDVFFRLFYLLGSVQGTVATEMVTIGTIQIVSQTFAIANETNGLYLGANGNSGILGLSFSPVAAIRPIVGATILDNIFGHLPESRRFFAFKLGRASNLTDPRATNSSFTIGKLDPFIVDSLDGTAQIAYYPVFRTQSSPYDYWKLPIRNLTIDGHALPLSASLVPGAPSPIAILDTGTTLILGPSPDVTAFWESIGTGRSVRYNAEANLWEARCDRAVDVRFAFGQDDNAWEYAVHPEDISWAEGGHGDGWCMGGVQVNDGVSSGDWLLGDVFLRNVYVVHQGLTSSKPALIGLASLTDAQSALVDFRNVRGQDPAPPPSVATRTPAEQWTENARIASAVSAAGGFLLGGLIVMTFKMGRRWKKAISSRW